MITFENLKLDLDLKDCYLDEEKIKLTKSEYNLLEFLVNNRNKVFSRRELSSILGSSRASLRSVDATISRLRDKLGHFSKHLVTKIGFGYYLA